MPHSGTKSRLLSTTMRSRTQLMCFSWNCEGVGVRGAVAGGVKFVIRPCSDCQRRRPPTSQNTTMQIKNHNQSLCTRANPFQPSRVRLMLVNGNRESLSSKTTLVRESNSGSMRLNRAMCPGNHDGGGGKRGKCTFDIASKEKEKMSGT
jgi:hypothetical protein